MFPTKLTWRNINACRLPVRILFSLCFKSLLAEPTHEYFLLTLIIFCFFNVFLHVLLSQNINVYCLLALFNRHRLWVDNVALSILTFVLTMSIKSVEIFKCLATGITFQVILRVACRILMTSKSSHSTGENLLTLIASFWFYLRDLFGNTVLIVCFKYLFKQQIIFLKSLSQNFVFICERYYLVLFRHLKLASFHVCFSLCFWFECFMTYLTIECIDDCYFRYACFFIVLFHVDNFLALFNSHRLWTDHTGLSIIIVHLWMHKKSFGTLKFIVTELTRPLII